MRAFIRYANAYIDRAEREEIYKVYVTEHLRKLIGSNVGYYGVAYREDPKEFDAEEVIDDVLTRMGFEEDEDL